MSTLAEIEAAIENLPATEQEALLTFLAGKVAHESDAAPEVRDSFEAVIGAFAGAHEATGRNAEGVLYGAPR